MATANKLGISCNALQKVGPLLSTPRWDRAIRQGYQPNTMVHTSPPFGYLQSLSRVNEAVAAILAITHSLSILSFHFDGLISFLVKVPRLAWLLHAQESARPLGFFT
ncbi:unnamed protein product [Nezara viridula]|uniref:Uncharacterized protein n=1 Tax=Nezara viridula TaxID=85310 RepID=A0A9P0H2Q8_NEZVI|nr:unnamed protein product [Nezara viridula]